MNDSVERVLKSITRLQLILQDKLETVARLLKGIPAVRSPSHPGLDLSAG